MGNDYDDGIDRSEWKDVSDSAKRKLEEARHAFHSFVENHSFDNIRDEEYRLTKDHAIEIHLVTKLRPQFNRYVAKYGARAKWVQLSAEEQKSFSKYKNRKSAVYFCNLTIDASVKDKMIKDKVLKKSTKRKGTPVEDTEEYKLEHHPKKKPSSKKRKLEDLRESESESDEEDEDEDEDSDEDESAEEEEKPQRKKGKVKKKTKKVVDLCNSDDSDEDDQDESEEEDDESEDDQPRRKKRKLK
mmetsp:Transcript_12389/g.18693  ORF Transcript_12389/g.18693 Transcript_12389/m.18693 type:complete len:243 (+) Transcript_12389:111-839(+)|eukprot:CAMPEP_0202712160 /NCGR_PEP_ID=MMETSP1385-20130828/34220_1 /ASSEMBLY_ACC=CAM_ASM_000861 /TAXON_ID=933848 /ORGANISM="Elphidium margaritaceum" /LENGTH=242 /DNA_ID=CAMNT_0049372103 /DNA_START=83 /DNA_END=811 /DNA_ORIENTATION=+